MPTFTVHQVRTNLSRLLARLRAGEKLVIAKGEEPIARLVPLDRKQPRRAGALKGRIALTAAFFEPLSADETAAWGEDP